MQYIADPHNRPQQTAHTKNYKTFPLILYKWRNNHFRLKEIPCRYIICRGLSCNFVDILFLFLFLGRLEFNCWLFIFSTTASHPQRGFLWQRSTEELDMGLITSSAPRCQSELHIPNLPRTGEGLTRDCTSSSSFSSSLASTFRSFSHLTFLRARYKISQRRRKKKFNC